MADENITYASGKPWEALKFAVGAGDVLINPPCTCLGDDYIFPTLSGCNVLATVNASIQFLGTKPSKFSTRVLPFISYSVYFLFCISRSEI